MNALNIIAPYKHLGIWVFDDPRVGLVMEPFVDDANEIIDRLTAHLPSPEAGFVMMFSAHEFPGHQVRLEWQRPDGSGNTYRCVELDAEGWLCPALLRYFGEPPAKIFVQVKAKP